MKKWLWAIPLIVLIIVDMVSIRRYEALVLRHEEAMAQLAALEAQRLKEVEGYKKEIARLQETVAQHEAVIKDKESELRKVEERLREVQQSVPPTAPPDQQIANLKEQLSLWAQKFSLCQQASSEKDDIIFTLKQQDELRVQIITRYETLYAETKKALDLANRRITVLERRHQTQRIVMAAVVTVAGVVLVRSLLK